MGESFANKSMLLFSQYYSSYHFNIDYDVTFLRVR